MPAIAGIISPKPRGELRSAAGAMLEALAQGSGRRSAEMDCDAPGASCGWTGPEGAFSSCMPAWNEDHTIGLLFNGEEFTDRPALEQLRGRGHSFRPDDASCLVHLYEEAGPKFLEELNGWFGGAVIDLRERKIILFNDRFGIGRVYYHEGEGEFLFASEAKALLKARPGLRRLDPRGLGELFSLGCLLQNRTLFAGVLLLPPASAWTFHADGRIEKRSYFSPADWEGRRQLEPGEYYERMRDTWRRILPRYFRGPGDAALSLTGGVDSRMILAWAPRAAGALPCYTFGGRYRDCADVKLSKQIARLCGQPHHVIPVGGEFLKEFPRLAERTVYLSDGAMDVTGAIDLYVQKAAREIAPIRVTGTNGGEILRSLVAFKPMAMSSELFAPEFLEHIRGAAQTYAEELRGHRLSFTAFKQAPWYMGSKFVLERSELNLRMPYFDNDLVSLVYQAPPEFALSNGLSLRLIAEGNPVLGAVATDRGLFLNGVPGVKQARNGFHEFTFKAEYAYDYGMPQWLAALDHAVGPLHLERLFLGRHKFHHFRVFYRDELSGFLKERLLDPRAAGRFYLRPGVLEAMVRGHTSGRRNYTLELHKALTVELIHRLFVDGN